MNNQKNAIQKSKFSNQLFIFLLVGSIQGIFYGILYPLVSGRKIFLFQITPYNLFPTDLIIFPIAVFFSQVAMSKYQYQPKVKIGFGIYYILFMIIGIYGLLIGYSQNNEYIIGDYKNLFIRSLFAPSVYYVSRYININKVLNKIVSFSTYLAILVIIRNVLSFYGIYLEKILCTDYQYTIWPEMTLLFPYCLLLSRFFDNPRISQIMKMQLIILSLGCISDFWKPNVASFLICTMVTLLFYIDRRRRNPVVIIRTLSILILLLLFLSLFLLFTTENNEILNMIQNTYLKKNSRVVDLSGGRFQIIALALNKWLLYPIFGTGLGSTISGHFFDAGLGKYIYIDRIYPHNLPIQILFQFGLLGAIPMGWIFISLLKKYFTNMKAVPSIENNYYKALGSYCITLILISLFSEVITSEVTGFFFWISFGLISSIIFQGRMKNDQLQTT